MTIIQSDWAAYCDMARVKMVTMVALDAQAQVEYDKVRVRMAAQLSPDWREPFDYRALSVGGHECATSPVGSCAYRDDLDARHDSCLYCGDPSERK